MYEEGGYMYEGYMYGKGGIRKMYWLHVRTRESLLKQYTGMCPYWLVVVVSTNHLYTKTTTPPLTRRPIIT